MRHSPPLPHHPRPRGRHLRLLLLSPLLLVSLLALGSSRAFGGRERVLSSSPSAESQEEQPPPSPPADKNASTAPTESRTPSPPPPPPPGGYLLRLPRPIIIVGAEERIGTLVAIGFAERGERVIALSRERSASPDSMIMKLAYGTKYVNGVDFNKPKTYENYFHKAKAVVFTAQARSAFDQDKQSVKFLYGDTPKFVEYRMLKEVAKTAASTGVPRLLMASMYMITRTKTEEYKYLNQYKRAMYWKREGELELIRQCKASPNTKYTIVRKTGPVGDKGVGLKNVTIRQGDYIRGTLPLEDLASVIVEAFYSNTTADTVFEAVVGEEPASTGFAKLVPNDGSAQPQPEATQMSSPDMEGGDSPDETSQENLETSPDVPEDAAVSEEIHDETSSQEVQEEATQENVSVDGSI